MNDNMSTNGTSGHARGGLRFLELHEIVLIMCVSIFSVVAIAMCMTVILNGFPKRHPSQVLHHVITDIDSSDDDVTICTTDEDEPRVCSQ